MEVSIKNSDTKSEFSVKYEEMKQFERELQRISQEIHKYVELIVDSKPHYEQDEFIKIITDYIEFIDSECNKDAKLLELLCVLVENKAPDENTCGILIDAITYYCPKRVLKCMRQIMYDNDIIDFLN